MLIVEDFLLLMLDPQSGLPRRTDCNAQRLSAAALLLDLAEQRRLQLRDTGLQADASLPATHPLLDQATQALGTVTLPAAGALETLARKLPRIRERVLDGLVRRDLLHRTGYRRWLPWRRWRYPLRSMQAYNESLERLRVAATATHTRGLALLALVEIARLQTTFLDAREQVHAEQRLSALNRSDAQADAALRIIGNVRQALLE